MIKYNDIKKSKMIIFSIIVVLLLIFNILYNMDFNLSIIGIFIGLTGSAIGFVFILFIIDGIISVIHKFKH